MKLIVYMKSGNKLELTKIKGYNIEYSGNNITRFSVNYYKLFRPKTYLVFGALNLSQIEAITCKKFLAFF